MGHIILPCVGVFLLVGPVDLFGFIGLLFESGLLLLFTVSDGEDSLSGTAFLFILVGHLDNIRITYPMNHIQN